MKAPLLTSARPIVGVIGEIRYDVDTDQFQMFDGKSWRIVEESNKTRPWQKWFAWRPVRVKGRWVMWKTVYRHHVLSPGGGFYRYGDMFDVLKDA